MNDTPQKPTDTVTAEKPNPPPVPKPQIEAGGDICAIVPRTLDEAYRLAECFVLAGMAPDSYLVVEEIRNEHGAKQGEVLNHKATVARVATGIMHGLAVGMAPTVALATIMIINGKPSIYGDGASALVNRSGKAEFIKTVVNAGEGNGWGPGYKVTVRAKRKDQSEEIVREFSYEDAKRAGLISKKGPWISYPTRQCYWRAWSWACRDAFSDALCGLAIAEEVRDFEVEARRNHVTDTSDLDDAPQQIEASTEKPLNVEAQIDAEQAALA